MPPLEELSKSGQKARSSTWYHGPDSEDVTVLDAIDLSSGDLVEALTAALKPRFPRRHGGRALTLLLLQVIDALSATAVRDSPDGRHLAAAVRDLLTGLKEESDRWAPTREPVVDRLRAWQAEGGPQLWQDAWARTLTKTKNLYSHRVLDERLTDGCASVTLAQYLLASEAKTSVDHVTTDDIRSMMAPGGSDERTGCSAGRNKDDATSTRPDRRRRRGWDGRAIRGVLAVALAGLSKRQSCPVEDVGIGSVLCHLRQRPVMVYELAEELELSAEHGQPGAAACEWAWLAHRWPNTPALANADGVPRGIARGSSEPGADRGDCHRVRAPAKTTPRRLSDRSLKMPFQVDELYVSPAEPLLPHADRLLADCGTMPLRPPRRPTRQPARRGGWNSPPDWSRVVYHGEGKPPAACGTAS
ncbi:hypothetical protein OIC43_09175 [Streptomyces sp. NBC_00825]|uniref:hypothetical protein n=1 Tax=unclassified Streptomyces TaxID=2593676 RepID=UPI002ED112C3|nr:hypothetical protein OG832_34525 [Streptomyces sp. NBC_00826]WTH89200.1 hypothetical protein OIC43_09175 [Streptomyces sp. NBC_00825]WTH97925.1 hypothetical protein OHA23_09160 [Streptomyces sp. NBC_00822]